MPGLVVHDEYVYMIAAVPSNLRCYQPFLVPQVLSSLVGPLAMSKENKNSAAASSLQSRIYQMVEKEQKENPDPPRKMGSAKTLKAWHRVIIAMLMLIDTTRKQMVLDYLQKKGAEEDDVEPEKTIRDKTNSTKKGKDEWIDQGIGQPLARSKAQKFWQSEVEFCSHPPEYMRCRANRYNQWWICLN